jgi:hypothetical protein
MSLVLVGSTSGSITLQEPAVAGSTVLTLPAVTGTILTTTSPKAGNVIQVVQATYNTFGSMTSTTYADTGLSATITPSASSSKILVLVSLNVEARVDAGMARTNCRILRNSTSVFLSENTVIIDAPASANNRVIGGGMMSLTYLDSPSTASSTTYKVQYAVATTSSNAVAYINNAQTEGNAYSTMTLMEIAG